MTTAEAPRAAAAEVKIARRRRQRFYVSRHQVAILVGQALVIAFVLTAWELLSGNPTRHTGVVDEFFVGKPTKIWQALVNWSQSGIIVRAAWVTLQETLAGFVLGSLLGMVVGFGLGVTRLLSAILAPLVYAAYSVPRLALVPMFILWFGLGMSSKIALVTLLVFFLTFFNTYAGAREVDDELIAISRLMRASRWQIVRKVSLPSAMVWVALGLQISVPYAFVGAIVGEIVAGNDGLGQLISKSSNQFDPNGMFAAIAVAVALSIALNAIVGVGSRYLMRWRSNSGRSEGVAAL
jgi:NitT/TauT family transport system permease protein